MTSGEFSYRARRFHLVLPDTDIRVAIVFAEDAGEPLARFAPFGHVWVVRSPLNEQIAQGYWWNPDQPFSVTLFSEEDSGAPAVERLRVVDVVEGHRLDYSGTHAYPILEVSGISLSAPAADYLRTYGFSRFEERADGFVARRPARPYELA